MTPNGRSIGEAGRRISIRRPFAWLFAVVVAALLGLPGSAAAHAVLTHTTPHAEAELPASPGVVGFDFNEPVEADFGSIRLYDIDGNPVAVGEVSHPGDDPQSLAVEIDGELPRGVYTATYRVVSADGHPVSGGFSFGVGEPVRTASRTAPAVADLLDQTSPGAAVEVSYGAARAVHYGALVLLVGAVFFALLVRRSDRSTGWPLRLLLAAAGAGLVSALLGVPLQGALAAGVQLPDAFDRDVLRGAVETQTGLVWLIRAGLWLALVNLLALTGGPPFHRAAKLLAVALVAALVATIPLGGHASTIDPSAVLVPADVVHVLAAGAWLGGLVLLLATYWPRGRTATEAATGATIAFSRLAMVAIAVLVAAGLLQTWFYLDGDVGDLVSGIWGWMIVAKLLLLTVVVGLARGNRRRVRSLADMGTGSDLAAALRRAMRAEVGLAVLILIATAVLVRGVPPVSAEGGPVERQLDFGAIRMEMIIEPATTGPNDYHLYLFNRETGEQVERVKEITLRLTQPEEDISLSLGIPFKNAAHYELLGPALAVPGTWEVDVDVRVSKFDEFTAETEIEVESR